MQDAIPNRVLGSDGKVNLWPIIISPTLHHLPYSVRGNDANRKGVDSTITGRRNFYFLGLIVHYCPDESMTHNKKASIAVNSG